MLRSFSSRASGLTVESLFPSPCFPQLYSEPLLTNDPPAAVPLNATGGGNTTAEAHVYGKLAFLSNYDSFTSTSVVFEGMGSAQKRERPRRKKLCALDM